MISSYFIALAMFVIASTATPGPNNLMMLSSGLTFGIKRSIPHWLGICTGVPFMLIAVGLGLDQLFQRWPLAFSILKVAGISYLLYLAFKIATHTGTVGTKSGVKPFNYIQGALFQWVNPKAWIMVLSGITAFTTPQEPLVPQVLTIASVFFLIGLVCVGSWLFAGSQLQGVLTKPSHQRIFNYAMALLLVCSIVPMLN